MIKRFKHNWKLLSHSGTAQAVFALFSSNLFIAIIGVVGAFIQGRFVSPADLGYFRQFGIISGYLFFLHFGIFHAIERSYPYYMGRGEKKKAVRIVEVGNAWMLMVCISLSLIFLVVSIIFFCQGNWKSGLGLLAQAFVLFTMLYGGFLQAIYRSGQDFKKMAKAQILGPLVSLTTLPIFWIQSYVALFLRNISQTVSLWPLYKNRPLKVKWRFKWKEWRQLIRQGLPRFTASYIMTTGLDAVRATIVLTQLGTMQLGYWSFSWTVMTMARQLPQAITAVFIPKIIKLYGETNSPSKCLFLCRKPVIFGFIVLCLIVPLGIIGTIYVFPVILPKYADVVGIICVLLLSLPLKLIEAPATILNAMNWLTWINACAIANALIQVISMGVGLYFGLGIYSMAIGVIVGNTVRVIMLWTILIYVCRLEKSGKLV